MHVAFRSFERRPNLGGRHLVAVCGMLVLAGCGGSSGPTFPPPVAASGKVSVQGKPVTGGTVHFMPVDGKKALPGFGSIQSDGSFKAQTKSPGDGLIPGEYVVFIEEKADPANKTAKGAVPEKYQSPSSSSLKQVINGPTDKIDIDLK